MKHQETRINLSNFSSRSKLREYDRQLVDLLAPDPWEISGASMAQELQVQGLMAQALHAGTGLHSTPCLGSSRGQHGSGAPGRGNMAQALHAGTGMSSQHGSGASGRENMVQALHAGTGLNSHSILGRFQGPAWLRSFRYRAESSSILGRFQGPAWLRSSRYRVEPLLLERIPVFIPFLRS
jgi:hypothetical protein